MYNILICIYYNIYIYYNNMHLLIIILIYYNKYIL